MLDQQAETVRGDHMSLLRGGGGGTGEGGEDGFPFKPAVHAHRRQPERRSGAAKSRWEKLTASSAGRGLHTQVITGNRCTDRRSGPVPTARGGRGES